MNQWIAHIVAAPVARFRLLPAFSRTLTLIGAFGCGGTDDEAAAAVGEHKKRIATSATHACAVRQTGLYCWGENIAGELGTHDTAASEAPVLATVAGTDIVEVATSTGRTCVRRKRGEVACWGLNEQGQIGDGTRNASLVPVAASGVADAIGMAIDDMSSCVLRRDQSVACWGLAPEGSAKGSPVPAPVPGLSEVVEVRNGMMGSYCALDEQQRVWCWRVVDGAWTAPIEFAALTGARTIALAAWDEVCVVGSAGTILCHNFDSGKTIPLERSENSVAVSAAGGLAACGKSATGTWQCWNVLPSMLESVGSKPIAIRSDVPIRDLAIGGFRVCALRQDESVACVDAAEMIGLMPQPEFAELPLVAGLPL